MNFENNIAFAKSCDTQDKLKEYRQAFLFPQHNGKPVVYMVGNSLGLQPKNAKAALQQELDDWEKYGVEGHFEAKMPWFSYHHFFKKPLAEIVGAKESEVTAMNGLTTNLHILMTSFYYPKGKRAKIICEANAFPSDLYALQSQIKNHGYNPDDCLIKIEPKAGCHIIEEEQIIQAIEQVGDELAMVMIGGVNYYTGQLFDMKIIAEATHKVGAVIGYDLAHAAGNVELKLHDWQVDFAAWCSYKYLNSGPGSVSGIFVHEKHGNNPNLPRFAGWWGYPEKERFQMNPNFVPAEGADGWQLSNAPVFSMAVHKVALDIFMKAGKESIFEKRDSLTAYLEFIIRDISARNDDCDFEIITPAEKNRRGSQLSVLTHGKGKALYDYISANGVMADWRNPNVIRLAPVPLYNSFEDIYRFGQILEEAVNK